jgi:dCMP deaminase
MIMLAEFWSRRSTCLRRSVGAVVYDPETYAILGSGYNDTPRTDVNCGDGGCPACAAGSVRNRTDCNCIHAELNAILLSRADIRRAHLAVYQEKEGEIVTDPPCLRCRGARIQAGIAKVLIGDGDHFEYTGP